MDRAGLLPYFHPTTVVYVDDDRQFLSLLPPRAGIAPYRCFHDPQAFLDELASGGLVTCLRQHCFNRYTGQVGDPEHEGVLGLDKWMLFMRLFNPRRFDVMSVAVIDYEMSPVDGLSL